MEDYTPYLPWIIMAVNGLIAGWLAGLILGGGGLIRDMIVGIIGAFVGGALVRAGWLQVPIPFDSIWAHQILVSTIGAILVLILVRIIGR
jgi:uncharacterized membrane protein YeaQ/YmgE (transglycosylase-associated protein family)